MESYIKIYRTLLNWEWFNDSKMIHVFIFILIKANYSDSNWRGIEVKRGQLITGLLSISKHTGLSTQSIRTCLNRLKSTNEITIKSTNKYSIITLVNYDKYQSFDKKITSKTTINITNEQQTINKQSTTDKKNKEYKNNKEYINPDFLNSVLKWFQYKSERKENYKSELSEKSFYNHLIKLSNNNPKIAEEIIEQSIANNWAGIFELKKKEEKKMNIHDRAIIRIAEECRLNDLEREKRNAAK